MKTTYADGDVYAAADVNDITGTINLLGSSVAYAAGKNKIINGDFFINQRNFTSTTTSAVFNLDRWRTIYSGGTSTTSVQTFTTGSAPVSGYEAKNFYRVEVTGQASSTDSVRVQQTVESVRTYAGQTTTYSFWAKASSGTPKIAIVGVQFFGTGGSPSASVTTQYGTVTLSTSWARYSVTCAIPSISGKTIGNDGAGLDSISIRLLLSAGASVDGNQSIGYQNVTFDTWGHQWEAGSTATAFQTATGTIQGELAACQRYYQRNTFSSGNSPATGYGLTMTTAILDVPFVSTVPMRVSPTAVDYANITAYTTLNGSFTGGTVSINLSSPFYTAVRYTHGSAVFTNNAIGYLYGTSGYVGLSAEL
jgi:hypothetical protein